MKERQNKMKTLPDHESLVYKKIVVPISMRSIYWKYFGFPADDDGEILSRDYIICSICQKQIRNNHNTTNLRIHLSNKHRELLQGLQASSSLVGETIKTEKSNIKKNRKNFPIMSKSHYSSETNMEGVVRVSQNLHAEDEVITCKVDIPEQDDNLYMEHEAMEEFYLHENDVPMDHHTLSDIITKFIVMDMLSPDIVNGSGFLVLVATLQPSAEIPTAEKIQHQLLPSLYDDTKTNLITKILEIKTLVSLSVEEWASQNGQKYVTFYVNYIDDKDLTIQTKVLKTVHCSDNYDVNYWANTFDNICSEFNISLDIISAVVVGWCDETISKAIISKGIMVIPCTMQTLQVCAEACFNHEGVLEVINKLCNNVNFPTEEEEHYEDCRTVWLSTYSLLEKSLQMRHSLEVDYELSEEEWHIIRDIIAVLAPLKTTVITLSESKLPVISVIKPIIWQLITSHFKINSSDKKLISTLKTKITNILNQRYVEKKLSKFLTTAAFLDIRFKLLPFASKSEIEEAKNNIQNIMKQSLKGKRKISATKDKKRLSGMEMLLGTVCSVSPVQSDPEELALTEFNSFQTESAACLDQCPLEWWFNNEKKYPQIFEAVRPFLSIPVCSIGLERISWRKYINHQNKRAALRSDVLDKIIFVNSNY